MNYDTNIEHEWPNFELNVSVTNGNASVAFFNDGSVLSIPNIENEVSYLKIPDYLYDVTSYIENNRTETQQLVSVLAVKEYNNSYAEYLFCTDYIDYFVLGAELINQFGFSRPVGNNSLLDNSYTAISNYPTYHDGQLLESIYTNGSPSGQFDEDVFIFDYSNLYYATGNYKTDVTSIRNSGINYYNTYFVGYSPSGLQYFAYGAPYTNMYRSAFNTGQQMGYADGYFTGYTNGYNTGINGVNVGSAPAQAFDYIGTAFGAVTNVLSLEVFPNVTLGLVFSIPLVFVLIMTIFKLVKK